MTRVSEEDFAEALCMTEDSDWEIVAARLGGELVNRERGDSGEYDTFLRIPMKPLLAKSHFCATCEAHVSKRGACGSRWCQ